MSLAGRVGRGRRWARAIHPDRLRWLDALRSPAAVLGLATAVAVACGAFLHPRAFVLAGATLSVLGVGLLWPWVATRGLSALITFDRDRVREGSPATARLAVRNRLPVAAWGLTVHDRSTGLGGGLARAGGWGETEVAWELAPTCWGVYPGADPRIGSAFPFGLREATRPLRAPAPLVVWPATFPVGPIPDEAVGRVGDGTAPRNRAGTDGDLLGVRPYRRGDSLRRVHWPQTARHGQLIVCELHALATPRVQVVVDLDPAAHAGANPDGTLAWTVRVAASFAEAWATRGAEVDLVLGRDRVRSGGGSVVRRRARLLDALAQSGLGAGPVPDLATVLDELDGDDGLRIVVTTDRAARRLAPRPGRAERFVVLRVRSFAAADDAETPLPVTPWITLDDPARVASQVRRGWKEGTRA